MMDYRGHIWRGFDSNHIISKDIDSLESPVKQLAFGQEHGLILTEDRKVYAFGTNAHGQLGNGEMSFTFNAKAPILISALDDSDIIEVSCGAHTSAAVSKYGNLYMWGDNSNGQCCVLGKEASITIPTLVDFATLPKPLDRPLHPCFHKIMVKHVSLSERFTFVITIDQELWGWGNDVVNPPLKLPLRIDALGDKKVLEIACGCAHVIALIGGSLSRSAQQKRSADCLNCAALRKTYETDEIELKPTNGNQRRVSDFAVYRSNSRRESLDLEVGNDMYVFNKKVLQRRQSSIAVNHLGNVVVVPDNKLCGSPVADECFEDEEGAVRDKHLKNAENAILKNVEKGKRVVGPGGKKLVKSNSVGQIVLGKSHGGSSIELQFVIKENSVVEEKEQSEETVIADLKRRTSVFADPVNSPHPTPKRLHRTSELSESNDYRESSGDDFVVVPESSEFAKCLDAKSFLSKLKSNKTNSFARTGTPVSTMDRFGFVSESWSLLDTCHDSSSCSDTDGSSLEGSFGSIDKRERDCENEMMREGRVDLSDWNGYTEVWAWGRAQEGQLGLGDEIDRTVPRCIRKLRGKGVMKVCAGYYHSLALTVSGQLFVWGSNSHGQLGLDDHSLRIDSPIAFNPFSGKYSPDEVSVSTDVFWDASVGNKHTLVMIKNVGDSEMKLFYSGKQENLADTFGSVGTDKTKPITAFKSSEWGRIVALRAGGRQCAVITSKEFANSISDFAVETVLSECRHFQQILAFQKSTVEPLINSESYTKVIQWTNGSAIQELMANYTQIVEATRSGIFKLRQMLQTQSLGLSVSGLVSDENNQLADAPLPIETVLSDYFAGLHSILDKYLVVFTNALAVNAFQYCAKHMKGCGVRELSGLTAESMQQALLEPLLRFAEYRQFADSALKFDMNITDEGKFSHLIELWNKQAMALVNKKEKSENTRAFWDCCPTKLADAVSSSFRRVLCNSKDHPVTPAVSSMFQTHWFVLCNDVFVHWNSSSGADIYPIELVWLETSQVDETAQSENTFTLRMPEGTVFVLTCAKAEDKTTWANSINSAIRSAIDSNRGDKGKSAAGGNNQRLVGGAPLSRWCVYNFKKTPVYAEAVYEGNWNNGVMHGSGKLLWSDGRCYIGQFRLGVMHGRGRMIYKNTSQEEGEGDTEMPGTIMEGYWRNGQLNGLGKVKYSNGDTYEGYLKDGLRHGHGVLKHGQFLSSAASLYIGEWVDGLRNGYGVMDNISSGEKYMGMWAEDKRHGKGCLVTVDGAFYEGCFVLDKMQGHGVIMYEDGSCFDGECNGNWNISGKGTIILPGGIKITGHLTGSWDKDIGLKIVSATVSPPGETSDKSFCDSLHSKPTIHGVAADRKWSDIFCHCKNMLGQLTDDVIKSDVISPDATQKAWEAVAIILTNWRKTVQINKKRKPNITIEELDLLDRIPLTNKGKVSLEHYQQIKDYLKKACESPYHPLGHLIEGVVDVYRATYVGIGANTRLLPHAIEELRSFINRIYLIVRVLFPDLPKQPEVEFASSTFYYEIRPSSPASVVGVGALGKPMADARNGDSEIITPSSLLMPLLLPSVYPTLFTLYALYNEKEDNQYWETSLKWNKLSDLGLLSFLGVDQKFWFTSKAAESPTTEAAVNVWNARDVCFLPAIDCIQRLSTAFCPTEKLEVIRKAFNLITQEVQDNLKSTFIWTMDDLFPVVEFVVVRARIQPLGSEIALIDDLMESHMTHGELGFMFTTIKGCYSQMLHERSIAV